jgi:predicted  nucleic acid-binding Zn-ribbon protein
MHKCVRCGRAAISLEEIDAGCPCGSKVFVFGRADAVPGEPEAVTFQREGNGNPAKGSEAVQEQAGGIGTAESGGKPDGAETKAPDSYHARMSFSQEDVENVKVLTDGVFVLDVKGLSRDPMVLKDEDGIYYVKIPFEQKAPKPNGKGGKKKENRKNKD